MKLLLAILTISLLIISHKDFANTYGQKRFLNSFGTIVLGEKEWMTHNLKVVTFRNGDSIPLAKTKQEWDSLCEAKLPAWCYYDNDWAVGAKYGKLYNWYAVNDSRGLAPEGWRIPSVKDLSSLKKESIDWLILGGSRNSIEFKGLGETCWLWSSDVQTKKGYSNQSFLAEYTAKTKELLITHFDQSRGCSVICVRDKNTND